MQAKQEDLDPVRPRGGVLEGVRGVGVEEAAAVGAEFFDGFLAGDGTAGDGLLPAGERVDDLVVQAEVLNRAAGDEDDRGDHGQRQQDSGRAAHQVNPEVAELIGVATRQAANERHGNGHADRSGDEVLHGEAGHLHEMALRRFTGVGLPVGVGHEADRGVPGECRRHRGGGVVEVQRQLALHELQNEKEHDADRREGKHAARVRAPRLFRFRVGPDQPVDDALTARILGGGVDPVHVVAERHVNGRQADDQ